ncbi:hypothetical protein [uncultured Pigmentiphaga sp.]|uniref:hypothetical protein n=1 Tax=uncultured Pigmentiphaga sp. TaxID=340361 RepID=UPI002614BBAF|nr:hypothetical protein [uncultured Pigmentiphaga sp.]
MNTFDFTNYQSESGGGHARRDQTIPRIGFWLPVRDRLLHKWLLLGAGWKFLSLSTTGSILNAWQGENDQNTADSTTQGDAFTASVLLDPKCGKMRTPKRWKVISGCDREIQALGRVPLPFLLRSDDGLVLTSRSFIPLVKNYGRRQEFMRHSPEQSRWVESHRVLKRLYFLRECSHEQEQ